MYILITSFIKDFLFSSQKHRKADLLNLGLDPYLYNTDAQITMILWKALETV